MRELRQRNKRSDVRKKSLQSNSFARRKRTKSILAVGLTIVAVSTILFGISEISRLNALKVSVIQVRGASQDSIISIRKAAEQELEGNYWYIFPRSNVLLYPRGAIRAAVADASPRVESVSVAHDGLTSLIVSVKEKDPVGLVCATFPDFEDSSLALPKEDDCDFVDEQGILFSRAPAISGTMYNRYYVPALAAASAKDGRLGLAATSTSEFAELQNLYAGLRSKGFEIEGILFKERGEYEAYVRNGARTTVIYFNNAKPLSVELNDLVLFWNHATEDARTKKKPLPVYEYIDVRYSPNLFFREVSSESEAQ